MSITLYFIRLDKNRIPMDNICPERGTNNMGLSCFPIASNEFLTVNHNKKHG
jgi:hypothetical protein